MIGNNYERKIPLEKGKGRSREYLCPENLRGHYFLKEQDQMERGVGRNNIWI